MVAEFCTMKYLFKQRKPENSLNPEKKMKISNWL